MLSLATIMATPTLILGNKAYSSWSLRGWLALKAVGCACDEVIIPLRQPDTRERILAHSPSGKVPTLVLDDLVIPESLAICEWVAETWPEAGLWPEGTDDRAIARAVACEMHAGFQALRNAMPMSVLGKTSRFTPDEAVQRDIDRIAQIWRENRNEFGTYGPWLFGTYSVADMMFAPVAIRFATFGIRLGEVEAEYCDALLSHPHVREWIDAGRRESWRIDDIDALFEEDWL
jgi:glutathione S-transferase